MALNAGVKHFPEEQGFLFHRDGEGITACRHAFETLGKDNTLKLIQECIPASANYPILHHVIKNNPEYLNDFAVRYPAATFLLDENQRSLHQVALISGMNFNTDSMFLLQMTGEKVEEKDPVTDLYPFMLAACAEKRYVSTIYYLLRRNPVLVEGGSRWLGKSKQSKTAGKKRKRSKL